MEARELMNSPVITITPGATVGEAARMMLDLGVSCLPVVDGDETPVGILTHHDFGLHARFHPLTANLYTLLGASATPAHIEEVSQQVGSKLVEEVMHHPIITVQHDASLAEVAEFMVHEHVHRLPVMREEKLVGIITRHDFLKLIAT